MTKYMHVHETSLAFNAFKMITRHVLAKNQQLSNEINKF